MRVAVLTCQGLPRFVTWEVPDVDALFTDDRMLVAALQEHGVVAEQVVWSAPGVDWDSYDVALIRSTWDYIDERGSFLSVLAAIESSSCLLFNAVDAVRWNSDKSYLFDLEAWGIPIVPTVRASTFLDDPAGWSSVVIKPTVGTGASDVFRLVADEVGAALERLSGNRDDYLVQPMVESVVTEGEWSFIFIAGEFSHALLKKPAADDYRTQGIYGGSIRLETPATGDLAEAEAILGALPYDLLYARLDLVRVDGRLAVMELELIEPILYFDHAPGRVDRLAAATVKAWKDARDSPTKENR
ncbi:ATP-grasp domain-containing protein [Homoserinimonas sp. A447]